MDLRVSTIPSVYGESVVLRILDRMTVGTELNELGLRPAISTKIFKALERPNGMLLVTGPTGSGKTTTLYAALHRLNDPRFKLFTIEDPVEYQIQGVVSDPINPRLGWTSRRPSDRSFDRIPILSFWEKSAIPKQRAFRSSRRSLAISSSRPCIRIVLPPPSHFTGYGS